MEDNVKFIRLTTGEDIISEVTIFSSDDENYYTLINPMKVLYLNNPKGSVSISLLQWVFYKICEEQTFTLYSNEVITVGKPSESLIEYYYSAVDNYNELSNQNKINKEDFLDENLSEEEGMDMIREILENATKDKRKLH
jgi:hypothetical protein